MTNWPKLIRQLQHENGMSERALCKAAKVNRSTYRRMIKGRAQYGGAINIYEALLAALGYELEIMLSANPCLHAPLTSAVVERSSHQASDANAGKPATGNATPDTIKSALPHDNADTQANGNKSEVPSSPAIPAAHSADSPQPWSTTSLHTKATAPCSGDDPTGSLYASPVIAAGSSLKSDNPAEFSLEYGEAL